jgi:hypothetical protein
LTDTAAPTRRPISWPLLIRQSHLWLGMLIAPSVLMFAFSGALQVFRLQESHPGYAPPALIERLGRLHKDQVFAVAQKRPARPTASAASEPAGAAPRAETPRPGPTLSKRLLQWFFTLVSAGLFVSTLLGVWMGATLSRWKISARWMLGAGVIVPVILLLLPF